MTKMAANQVNNHDIYHIYKGYIFLLLKKSPSKNTPEAERLFLLAETRKNVSKRSEKKS